MNRFRILIGVFILSCGLLILLPVAYASPLSGVGSLPYLPDDRAFELVMVTPVLLPVLIILTVVLALFATVFSSESTTHRGDVATEDPVEVLKQAYAAGEITHAEYERRLKLLLDVDSMAAAKERLEWLETDEHERH